MRLVWAVRRNSYFDSIDLMRVAEQARQLAGVAEVAVVMGSPPGRAMLAAAGMWPAEAPEAGPSDLLISVRASTEAVANRALASVEELLSASRAAQHVIADRLPRTTAAAARGAAATNVALIAVPGAYAAVEAHQALSAGLHVFLFSDGVSMADEVALKRRARDRGLLVMGPECGTAIINGVGLGFANRVRRPRYAGSPDRLEAIGAADGRRRAPGRRRDPQAHRSLSARIRRRDAAGGAHGGDARGSRDHRGEAR